MRVDGLEAARICSEMEPTACLLGESLAALVEGGVGWVARMGMFVENKTSATTARTKYVFFILDR